MNQYDLQDTYLRICDSESVEFECRLYQTPQLAVYDLTQTLIHFMPHKNKVALIPQGTSAAEVVTAVGLKNQCSLLQKKAQDPAVSFVEALDASTHFLFWTSENEVTGEIIFTADQCLEIHQILNRKKIFSIHYTCVSRQFSLPVDSPYSFVICTPGLFCSVQETTRILFHPKHKINLTASAYQRVDHFLIQANGAGAMSSPCVDRTINRKDLYNQRFSNPQFLADRYVLQFEKVNAAAVKEALSIGDDAFTPAQLPSWVTEKWVSWWPEAAHLDLSLFLIISARVPIIRPHFFRELDTCLVKLCEDSRWIV